MHVRTPADIALLIRERRRELRVSQQQLAQRIGASRQWVQNLEQGRPGLELGLTLRALAALGLSLDARPPAAGVVAPAAHAGRHGLRATATGGGRGWVAAADLVRGPAPKRPGPEAARPARGTPSPASSAEPPLVVVDLDSIVSGPRARAATRPRPGQGRAPRGGQD